MKKRMLLFSVIAVALIYSLSCRRQVDVVNNHEQNLIEKAQNWFTQLESTAKFQEQFKQVNYLWNKAEIVTLSNKNQAIAVPIVERNARPGYHGIRFLYLYPWKNGKSFYTEVQEILPDLDYTVYNRKIALKTFSGYVARWDLERGFSYGTKYKQGVAVSGADLKIVPIDSVNTTARLKQSGRILDPVTVIAYIHRADNNYYQINIVPFETDYNYHYNPCEYTNCNPIDLNEYYTDEMLQNMLNAYLGYLFSSLENKNIKDSTNDPCVASVLGTLQSISQSLPDIVNTTFSSNANFTITIKEGDLGPNGRGRTTYGGGDYSNFLITLNSVYNSRTDLSTAATLIHEALHAQLNAWYGEAVAANNTQLKEELEKNYGFTLNNATINTSVQHDLMADHFIGSIASALQTFASSRGIEVTMQDCKDIAWTGLTATTLFTNLSQTDRDRIQKALDAELDPKKTSVNQTNQAQAKGKGCDPN